MNSTTHNIRPMILASMFAALTAIGAFIKIPLPFSPVPITLQVLFVLLAGLLLGSRWAVTSMMVYVLLGIIGLPVFSGGTAGIGVLLGPTGGYLVGFVVGAYVIGIIAEHGVCDENDAANRNKSSNNNHNHIGTIRSIVASLSGLAVIFLFGVIWLSIAADLSITKAMAVGLVPFIPGGIIKVAAAVVIADRLKPMIQK